MVLGIILDIKIPAIGDVTSKITTTGNVNPNALGTYTITYTVKDTSGNTLIQRSNVFKLDNTIPVITVNPVSVTITEGSSYTDTGVSASDAHSGLNGSVTSSGTVNIKHIL